MIDLFAGPGGLSEGFTRFADWYGSDIAFRSVLSIEKEGAAVATLLLRSFFRQFSAGSVPAQYWEVLKGLASVETLREFPEWQAAQDHVWQAELGKIDLAELHGRIESRLNGAPNWLLLGGPPCQAYSLIGRARMTGVGHDARQDEMIAASTRTRRLASFRKDVRHKLYREYLRIIAVHQPSVFVMENVKGILSARAPDGRGAAALMFDRIREDLSDPWASLQDDADLEQLEQLARPGRPRYRLAAFCAPADDLLTSDPRNKDFLLRSEDYGIPQKRHRVIILGIREDIPGAPGALNESKRATVRDAIGHLPSLRSGVSGQDSEREWQNRRGALLSSHTLRTLPKAVQQAISDALSSPTPPSGRGSKFVRAKARPRRNSILERWLSTDALDGFVQHESRSHMDSDLSRYLFAAACAQVSADGRSPRLEDWPPFLLPAHRNVSTDRSGAVTTSGFNDRFKVQTWDDASSTVTSHIAKDGHYFIHPDPVQGRSLTVREAARLQTFPDDYFFCGNRTQQYHQVGNAVPPYLAVQLARAVEPLLRGSEAGEAEVADVHSPSIRSFNMSRIGGKDTAPEMALRSALHKAGRRFRVHRPDLPGKPDIVLPKDRVAVFVHGCFWHRHAGCRYMTTPKTNESFWAAKFGRTVERDRDNMAELTRTGWRVFVAWECDIRRSASAVADDIERFVISDLGTSTT